MGTDPKELPQFIRTLFQDLFKDHNVNEPILWWQIIKLRAHLFAILQQYSVPIYRGIPQITNYHDHIQFKVTQDNRTQQFVKPADVYVYDWHRSFEPNKDVHTAINQFSHTLLYQMPRSLVPKEIVFLGDGESALWAAMHFPDSTIYYLSRSREPNPLESKRKATSKHVEIKNAVKVYFDSPDGSHYKRLHLQREKDNSFPFAPRVEYYDPTQNRTIKGYFFTCTGMFPQVYTQDLLPENVLRLKDEHQKTTYVANSNNPRGSLTHSYLDYMNRTGNMERAWELDAMLIGNKEQPSYMQKFLAKYGITEEHLLEMQELLRQSNDQKDNFSAMVKLYETKINSDSNDVAAFAAALRAEYIKKAIPLPKPN